MEAVKDGNVQLVTELQSCKAELEEKSQQYEAAESQIQALQRAYSKLEEGFEQVAGEIEVFREKVRFLAGENAELLRQNGSLSQQEEQAKEEKIQLVSELRGLCLAVFNKYDFRDESAAMEAIDAAFNKLRADCDSLREKETAATRRAEELDGDKGLLETANCELKEKLKDFIQLQEAKQQLQSKLERLIKGTKDMANKFRDQYEKSKQEKQNLASAASEMQALHSQHLKRGEQLGDMKRRLKRAVSCMRDQIAAHKAERQRLQEECACQQSTIVSLRAENESLHDVITKFEQIAQTQAEDLAQAEEKNKSLEDALAAAKKEITPLEEREKAAALQLEKDTHIAQLETKLKDKEEWVAKLEHTNAATADAVELLRDALAAAKKEIMPLEEREKASALLLEKDTRIAQLETKLKDKDEWVAKLEHTNAATADAVELLRDALAAAKKEIPPLEEREKAAALLLEKDTRIAQLETELKDKEEWVAKLEHTNAATADAVELLRESTEGLSSAVAGHVAALNLERERRENRVDCDVQTEDSAKVDSDMQTEVAGEKVDCEAQTVGALCEDTAEKLAYAQLEVSRLNVALQQLGIENESLRNNYTESERNFIRARNACSTLKQEMKGLKKQVEVNSKKEEEMKEGIHSLESLLASKEREAKEHLEASDQASAALKAQNEKLTAEVSELNNHVKRLHERLLYQASTSEKKFLLFERLLYNKQEEVDILKKKIADLKDSTDATPPVHKVTASAEQKLAQVVAEKPVVVTSTPVTNPGEPVASTSKVLSPMEQAVGPPASKGSMLSSSVFAWDREERLQASRNALVVEVQSARSCVTAKDARPCNKALSASPLKRTLGTDQDRVDHPVATKKTAVTSLPPSAQSTAPQPVTKKRKYFTSRSGH